MFIDVSKAPPPYATFGTVQPTTWHHNPEDLNPQKHDFENLKSAMPSLECLFVQKLTSELVDP
jgi:hypothetical protein